MSGSTRWLLAGVLAASACSLNPATGRVQAFLISEDEEVALGRKNDAEIMGSMRAYEEAPALTKTVERVGAAVAQASERPQLPWTFRVLDDPSVNAFALPGGFVYITRGLLVHLNSEAELAGVLGHEAGHVTARHGAVQLRKTNVARRSVGVFRVVDPGLRHIGGIAAGVAGLALLKYSRDDEYQADDLALRYVNATGYDPGGVPEVFSVLSTVAEQSGRVPSWLSTHPEPELRQRRVANKIGKEGLDAVDPRYLKLIDGVLHGRDARDGFVLEGRYVQPRAGFRITLPEDWKTQVDASGVVGLAPEENALFVLGPSEEADGKTALASFFAETQTAQGEVWEGKIDGTPVITAAFSIAGSGSSLTGLVAFFDFKGQVVAVVAAAQSEAWAGYADAVATMVSSFRALGDPALRSVKPMRIELTTLKAPTTLAALNESAPSSVSVVELGRLNHAEPDETLPAGRIVKRVVGFNPDAGSSS